MVSFYTYSFGQTSWWWSMFEIKKRVSEEFFKTYPLVRISCQQPQQKITALIRDIYTIGKLKQNVFFLCFELWKVKDNILVSSSLRSYQELTCIHPLRTITHLDILFVYKEVGTCESRFQHEKPKYLWTPLRLCQKIQGLITQMDMSLMTGHAFSDLQVAIL